MPIKDKTNKFLLPFICCWLGRSRIQKERKEKTREKSKGKTYKKKSKEKEKEKWENNLVNLQSPTYKTLI